MVIDASPELSITIDLGRNGMRNIQLRELSTVSLAKSLAGATSAQQLSFADVPMEDTKTLRYYDVVDGATLVVEDKSSPASAVDAVMDSQQESHGRARSTPVFLSKMCSCCIPDMQEREKATLAGRL